MLSPTLPFRNLLRQRGRTALAVASLAGGVIALLLAGGFMEWIFWIIRESTIQSRLGHVQVVRVGYGQSGLADPFAYLLPDQADELTYLERLPQVRVVAPRLNFGGLVSHGEQTVSFIGEGVDPARETVLSKYVIVTAGRSLTEGAQEVFMGEGLAASLGVHPGDSVVLLATPQGGGMQAVEARVCGLFYSATKAYDDSALRVSLGLAQKLLRVRGAHQWVMLLKNTEDTETVVKALRARYRQAGTGFEVVPWYDLADFYKKTVTLFSRQMQVLWLMIALVIVLGISTLLIRGVIERTGEIGTMLALGIRRRQVLGLFLMEGAMLGLIGATLGVLIGLPLAWGISAVGIPMPPPPGMNRGFTGQILITLPLLTQAITLALGTALLASVYPAFKASRMRIVDALRHHR